MRCFFSDQRRGSRKPEDRKMVPYRTSGALLTAIASPNAQRGSDREISGIGRCSEPDGSKQAHTRNRSVPANRHEQRRNAGLRAPQSADQQGSRSVPIDMRRGNAGTTTKGRQGSSALAAAALSRPMVSTSAPHSSSKYLTTASRWPAHASCSAVSGN